MDIKKEVALVISLHNGLEYSETENTLIGKLNISEYDSYMLKINLTHYPNVFPDVEEIDERIPKKANRHVYEDSGTLCFTTRAISQILLKTKIKTLFDFITHILIPYLENNSFYEINKRYVEDEFAHGVRGVLDGYIDVLGISGDFRILKIINDAIQGRFSTKSGVCYCGSNKSLKTCHSGTHYRKYKKFLMIERDTLMNDAFGIMIYKRKE